MKFLLENSQTELEQFAQRCHRIAHGVSNTINKYLDTYGFEVEYIPEYEDFLDEMENCVGLFLASTQDIASVFPMTLNIPFLFEYFSGKSHIGAELDWAIESTMWHEAGHGIVAYLSDFYDFDWDEEEVVEEFARCMCDGIEQCELVNTLEEYSNETFGENYTFDISNNIMESDAPEEGLTEELAPIGYKQGNEVEFNEDAFSTTNRLFIVGLSGSGKSTLGKKLSKEYNGEYVELDKFDYEGNTANYSQGGPNIVLEFLRDNPVVDDFNIRIECFIAFILEKNLNTPVIIEGVQLLDFGKELANESIILLDPPVEQLIQQFRARETNWQDVNINGVQPKSSEELDQLLKQAYNKDRELLDKFKSELEKDLDEEFDLPYNEHFFTKNGYEDGDMIKESHKMRFNLTEGKNLEQTVQQYIDKYRKIVPAATDEMHRNQVMGLIAIDPTYKPGGNVTGDYAIWILNQAIKNGWDVLGAEQKLLAVLNDFVNKKSLLKNKDINSYKSPEELAQALSGVEFTDRQKERRARNATSMTKKVLSTENWDVYMALNWEGALTLGKGTSWCTADSENAGWYVKYIMDYWHDENVEVFEVKDCEKEHHITIQELIDYPKFLYGEYEGEYEVSSEEEIYAQYSDRAVFVDVQGEGFFVNPFEKLEDTNPPYNRLFVFIDKRDGSKYQFCMSEDLSEYEEDLEYALTFCDSKDRALDFRDFIGYRNKDLRQFWEEVMGYSLQELFAVDPDEEDDIEESLSTNKMRFTLVEAKADTQRLISWAGEDLANRFIAIKDRLKSPENDLYYWIKNGSLEDFEKVITNIENSKSNTQLKADASDGAELVSENSHWKVYHITTFEASQKYGRDTKWCITGINGYGDKYWNDYTNEGIKFYFFISKVDYDDRGIDSKFALALQSDYTWELYNQTDDQVYNLPDTKGLYIDGISVKKLIRGDIVRCAECGDIIDKDEAYFSPNNEHICELCFSTKYDFCDNCDELFEIDSLNHIDDNKYCDSCTDYCPNCGAGALYSDIEDGMCPSCRDEEEIDESYKSNRMRFTLIEGIADVKKHYQDISDRDFDRIIRLDPTFNENRDRVGTYGKWLLNLFRKGNLNNEGHVSDLLNRFESEKPHLKDKDIGRFKSLDEVDAYLNDDSNYTSLSHRQEVRQRQKDRHNVDLGEEAELAYEDDEWQVWMPKTYAASCKLGRGTRWCTASTEDDYYFNYYTDRGPLYINIDKKTGKKYQFHFETESFMDENDDEISLAKLFTENEKLFDVYASFADPDFVDEMQYKLKRMKEFITKLKSNGGVFVIDGEDADDTYSGYSESSMMNDDDIVSLITEVLIKNVDYPQTRFIKFPNLKKVTIGEGVTKIRTRQFADCDNLTTVIIKDGVTTIGEEAFKTCSELTDVRLPSTLETIKSGAFQLCASIEHIEIPESVTSIYNGAFRGCVRLKKFTIPSSVTFVGENLFRGDYNMTEVNYFARTTIPKQCFGACYSLSKINIGEGVNCIESNAFYFCNGLTKITLPESLTVIYDDAFNGCHRLRDIKISSSTRECYSTSFPVGATVVSDTYNKYVADMLEDTGVFYTSLDRKQESLQEDLLEEDIAAVKKNFPMIDDDTFMVLIALDPTFNPNRDSVGTYGKWILTLYNKGEIKDEDWDNVTQMLDVWETNKKRFTNRDIGQFKTLKQLEDALLNMPDLELSHRQKVRQNQRARRGVDLGTEADIVFDGSDWEVWVPKTYSASCKLGQHTSWCTATTESDSYYKNYTSQGPLYILIDKGNDRHKYQFHFETNSFMNRDDDEINLVEFLRSIGEEVSDFFFEKLFDSWDLLPGLSMDATIEVEIKPTQLDDLLGEVTVGYNNVPGNECFELMFNAEDYMTEFYYDDFYEELLGVAIECTNEENKKQIEKLTGVTDLTTAKIINYDGFLYEAFIDAIKKAYIESAAYNAQTDAVLSVEDAASAVKGIRADLEGNVLVVKGKLSAFVDLYSEYYDFADETNYCFDDNLSKAVGTCLIQNYDFQKPRADEWGELEDDPFNEYLESALYDWFGNGDE